MLFAKVPKRSRKTGLQTLFPVGKHKLFKPCVHPLENMFSYSVIINKMNANC